jgi:hypothetical protein
MDNRARTPSIDDLRTSFSPRRRVGQHGLRHAAQQQPSDYAEAARAHDDEIGRAALDVPRDRVGGRTGEHHGFDRG